MTTDLTARITEILRQSGVLLPIGGMDYRTPEQRQEVLAALLAAAAEEHYRPRVIEKVEQPYCWSQGPRIGHESTPICFEDPGHSGPHRSHPGSGFNEQWGDPAYPVPECQRHEWWSPGAGE